MYKYKKCLIALVCWLVAGSAEDCAGNSTLARAAEGFRTRLAAATAGCQVVVYTTLFYGAGVRFPHPRGRLGPEAYNGTAGECYLIVAGAASAASLREHCDVSPWRVVEMGASVHGGRRASRTLKLLPHRYFTARYVVFLDWKLSLRQHPLDLVDRTLRSGDFGFAAFRHPCTTPSARKHQWLCQRPASVPWWRQEARLIHKGQRTATPEALDAQVARYGGSSLDVYIDGALLLWDLAHPVARTLSCAWWTEYNRPDSSDRDQLAFAKAVEKLLEDVARPFPTASTRAAGLFLISEGRAGSCGALCHHYESDTTLGWGLSKTLHGAPGPPCETATRGGTSAARS